MAHLRRLALNALPPNAITHPPAAIDALATFLATHRRVAVLTGAGRLHFHVSDIALSCCSFGLTPWPSTLSGLSTDSGIPDYRSPGRPPHQPLQHSQFVESSYNRQRYWARSLVGKANRACGRFLPNRPHTPPYRLSSDQERRAQYRPPRHCYRQSPSSPWCGGHPKRGRPP
jgi:hypothetical protein